MRRGITSTAGLLASIANTKQDKSIEAAGGFWAPEKPNRELRRRMEREAKREQKALRAQEAKQGEQAND